MFMRTHITRDIKVTTRRSGRLCPCGHLDRRSYATAFTSFKEYPSEFKVTHENGFLPMSDPLHQLPSSFRTLESLLDRMSLTQPNGSLGLLSKGEFGDAVHRELPEYDVSGIKDSKLLTALFRDYTFAASAYLLEPCDIMNRKRGEYGLGRSLLPRNLAVPLSIVAKKLGAKPFMEYAQSYALYNYKRMDTSKPVTYENLELIRKLSGMPAEHGFILVHVAMVSHTGKLVKYTQNSLTACDQKNRPLFNENLKGLLATLQEINVVMETMWKHSATTDYIKFRTFIMGTKNQPMFPNGVIYEGVSTDPFYYRGESGANDSIIPTTDNFLQLTEAMPENPLTEILRDFRSYRPHDHNKWVSFVESEAKRVGIKKYAQQDPESALIYLCLIDQVREFRARHWNFTKEYIIKWSDHPVATGGSPIITWLPNQLRSVLTSMVEASEKLDIARLSPVSRELAAELKDRASTQRRILDREVQSIKKDKDGKSKVQKK